MLCSECGKNEATVHITEIEDNSVGKVHLCEECARKKGIDMSPPESLSEIISGMAEIKTSPEDEGLTCRSCGLTLKDMKTSGRLGCGQCYITFKESLDPLIKTLHKAVYHTGKVPSAFEKIAGDIQLLRKELQEAVKKEEYEKAARLRDRIKALLEKDKSGSLAGSEEKGTDESS